METKKFELECKTATYEFLTQLAAREGNSLNEQIIGMIHQNIHQNGLGEEYFNFRNSFDKKR